MYFWEENRANIWDYAPRPNSVPTESQRQGKLQCLCHGTSWSNHTSCVLQTLKKSTKSLITNSRADIEKELKSQVCSCGENKADKPVLNLPEEEMEQKIWDVHTYFNNLFNAKQQSDLASTTSVRDFLSKVMDECVIYNDKFRYVFLQRLKSFLQLQLLDIEAFVEQLIVEQTQGDLARVNGGDSHSATPKDSILEQFEPSVIDWLEQCVSEE